MSPLLAPILAQLVTLSAADRTEARSVVTRDEYAVVQTSPRLGLDFGWKHSTFGLSYGPSITIGPIGQGYDASTQVFHSGVLAASHRWQRSTLTMSESLGIGRIDLRTQALGDPRATPVTTAPNGTPGANGTPPVTGGTGGAQGTPGNNNANPALPGFDKPLTFRTSVTSISLTQLVSPVLTVSSSLSYSLSGSYGADRTANYPTVQGPGAQVSAGYKPTRDDELRTSATTQLALSSNGNRAWSLSLNETWSHRLARRTIGSLGSGVSMTRNSQDDGLVYYSIFPNFIAGINNTSQLGRALLNVGTSVASAPYVDPVLALVDPRVSANVYAALSQGNFSTSLSASGAFPIATGLSKGAFNSVSAAWGVNYRLGAAVSLDSGVRAAWQRVQGVTTLPLSVAVYAGISIALSTPLNGGH
jgi:hypothetical protein